MFCLFFFFLFFLGALWNPSVLLQSTAKKTPAHTYRRVRRSSPTTATMTMMMTDSQFGLGDMEGLLWGHSSPMADPTGRLNPHSDPAEEPHGPEGPLSFFASSLPSSFSSPSTSSSFSASPPAFYSPPASPPHGDKAGLGPDVLSLPWLASSPRLGLVGTEVASGKGKDPHIS